MNKVYIFIFLKLFFVKDTRSKKLELRLNI